jgi:hypothetical protein
MDQDLIDKAVSVANRMAAARGIDIDHAALKRSVLAVIGTRNGQNNPDEIAEDALELLGKALDPSAFRRGRRPF